MLEELIPAMVGFGAASACVVLGYKLRGLDPYEPAHKRTEHDVKKDENKLEKHFSVINIEDEASEIVNDMDSEQERPFGDQVEDKADVYEYEASVLHEPATPKRKRCSVCNMFAKALEFEDGKFYCAKHAPIGPMKMSD